MNHLLVAFFKLIFVRPGVRRLRNALNERLVGKPMPVLNRTKQGQEKEKHSPHSNSTSECFLGFIYSAESSIEPVAKKSSNKLLSLIDAVYFCPLFSGLSASTGPITVEYCFPNYRLIGKWSSGAKVRCETKEDLNTS